MDDPFGNSLVIEMRDFFAQDEVFEQCRAAAARFEGVLVVGDDESLICGEHFAAFGGLLMRFAAICARGFGRRGALRESMLLFRHVSRLQLLSHRWHPHRGDFLLEEWEPRHHMKNRDQIVGELRKY